MAKWKTGWKVIMWTRRMSCIHHRAVCYPKNKIAHRPKLCGPLAVFETRKAARYFISQNWSWINDRAHNRKVVKCLYIPSEDSALWDAYDKRCVVPERTAFADEVKCLE